MSQRPTPDDVTLFGGRQTCRADRLAVGTCISAGWTCGPIAELRRGVPITHEGEVVQRVSARIKDDDQWHTWWPGDRVYLEPPAHLLPLLAPPAAPTMPS